MDFNSCTDSAGNQYQTLFIQIVDEHNRVHVVFYRAVRLGAHDLTAEAQHRKIKEAFINDLIYNAIKEKIVAFISDSAAVLQGDISGEKWHWPLFRIPVVYLART